MIKNLFDTHTFLWFIDGNDNLSSKALENIENENAQNFFSIVSLWEIAIKLSLGKLEVNIPFKQIEDVIFKNNFQIRPISFTDLLKLSELPFHHRDPFDRLLIAQGINNEMIFYQKMKMFLNIMSLLFGNSSQSFLLSILIFAAYQIA